MSPMQRIRAYLEEPGTTLDGALKNCLVLASSRDAEKETDGVAYPKPKKKSAHKPRTWERDFSYLKKIARRAAKGERTL